MNSSSRLTQASSGKRRKVERQSIRLIGIIGPQAGGKGTFTAFVEAMESKNLVEVISSSDIIADLLRQRGAQSENRDAKRALFEEKEKSVGPDWLAREMGEAVCRSPAKVVMWDSIRTEYDWKEVQKNPNHEFVYITAPSKTRHERAMARRRDDEGEISYEQFVAREQAGNEKMVPILGRRAPKANQIENIGTQDEFYQQLFGLYQRLILPWLQEPV